MRWNKLIREGLLHNKPAKKRKRKSRSAKPEATSQPAESLQHYPTEQDLWDEFDRW